MDHIYILGVKVHKIKKDEILKKINEWLEGQEIRQIATVNPEFILDAQKDKEFKEILNNVDLSVPDGIGLKFAGWLFGRNLYRITGVDLTKDILKIAAEKNKSVYFFIWKHGFSGAEEVKNKLRMEAHHSLRIDGQGIEKDGGDIDWKKFNDFSPDILLVGLGAPYQELLIKKIKLADKRNGISQERIPPSPPLIKGGIKITMGVGTTFDFLSGSLKRAPKVMRILGLEWLYRALKPPKPPYTYFYRIKRVARAVIIFPWNVILCKIREKNNKP